MGNLLVEHTTNIDPIRVIVNFLKKLFTPLDVDVFVEIKGSKIVRTYKLVKK